MLFGVSATVAPIDEGEIMPVKDDKQYKFIKYHPQRIKLKLFMLLLLLILPSANYADVVDEKNNGQIIVFVSLGMPAQSLKQWLYQANQAGASVVIRGLIDNSFKKTASKIASIVKQSGGGIAIDPQAFERFQVNTVPAVVSVDDNTNAYDIVYGDISLNYALDLLIAQGSIFNPLTRQALARLTTHD
jgi:conjugal transfer pilus assembly protein TrbC